MAKLLRDLPIGSKVKDITWEWEHRTGNNYSGSGKTKPVTWLIVAKNHDTYPNNSVTLLTHELIAKHCFDRGDSNHYDNSEIREFLNGTFYNSFSKEFKDAILETTVQNKNRYGSSYTTKDKVFLPSQTEYGGGSSDTYPIGADYGYFNSDSSRIAKLDGEVRPYWTRSPRSSYTNRVQLVGSNGLFSWTEARYGSFEVRPALNLKSDILVSDSPDDDGAYTIIWTTLHRITLDKPITINAGEKIEKVKFNPKINGAPLKLKYTDKEKLIYEGENLNTDTVDLEIEGKDGKIDKIAYTIS